jgi:hypothetical protein
LCIKKNEIVGTCPLGDIHPTDFCSIPYCYVSN